MKLLKLFCAFLMLFFSTAYANPIKITLHNNSGYNFNYAGASGYWQNVPEKIANDSTVEFTSPEFAYTFAQYSLIYRAIVIHEDRLNQVSYYLTVWAEDEAKDKIMFSTESEFFGTECKPIYQEDHLIALDCRIG